jgi:putative tryptophan/tyrosine transport system substrate-binding protein
MIVALIADVCTASAQQPGRVYKLAFLWTGELGVHQQFQEFREGTMLGFREGLRDSGYVEGKNLVVDLRDAQGDVSRLPVLVDALIAAQPDVLVTPGTAPTVAAMRATNSIPIVFPGVGTPVERGIVKSLVNHGGNATGQAVNLNNPKMLQLLRDTAPSTRRLGWVAYAPNSFARDRSPEYRARRMTGLGNELAPAGFEAVDLMVDSLDELEPKVAALASRGQAALFMSTDVTLFSWRAQIMEVAMRYRLPTACAQRFGWAKEGCLITYGENPVFMGRRAAAQVVKILNGTKPSDIPIEQPTNFKLIVNANTAKTLGLTMPPSLLALADEVIE